MLLRFSGDPSRNRNYAQFFRIATHPAMAPIVFHGTCSDFDGDGDLDLLISYFEYKFGANTGYFALFAAAPTRPGRPALKRLY